MASRGQAREVTQPSWLHGKREGTRSVFGHLFRASRRSRRRRDRPIRARKGIGLYFPRPKPSDCVFEDARRSRKARVTRLETHPLSTPRRERVSAMVSVSKLLAMQWDCVGKGRRGRGERGLKETLGLQVSLARIWRSGFLQMAKKPKFSTLCRPSHLVPGPLVVRQGPRESGGAGGAFGWISPLGSTARDAYRRGRSVSIGVGVGESPQHALNPRGGSTFCVVLAAHRRVIFLRRTITLYLRSSTEPPWGTRRSRRWETSSCSS